MTKIFCDVGGTHIRFAYEQADGTLSAPRKTAVSDYQNFFEAIKSFTNAQSIDPVTVTDFYFAFSHRNGWDVNPNSIRAIIPTAFIKQINDFEANAYGIAHATPDHFECLYKGEGTPPPHAGKAVIGAGTGLGLAFITAAGEVVPNHGGHKLPPIRSQNDLDLYAFIRAHKKQDTISIIEDVVSGDGLFYTYLYLCQHMHCDVEFRSSADIMQRGLDDPIVKNALEIFHEMLGMFMHQAVGFNSAYGGVYLTGGMIDKLRLAGKLDIDRIVNHFHQYTHPVVRQDVNSTSVSWVNNEYISLSGLQHVARLKP